MVSTGKKTWVEQRSDGFKRQPQSSACSGKQIRGWGLTDAIHRLRSKLRLAWSRRLYYRGPNVPDVLVRMGHIPTYKTNGIHVAATTDSWIPAKFSALVSRFELAMFYFAGPGAIIIRYLNQPQFQMLSGMITRPTEWDSGVSLQDGEGQRWKIALTSLLCWRPRSGVRKRLRFSFQHVVKWRRVTLENAIDLTPLLAPKNGRAQTTTFPFHHLVKRHS